MNPDIYKYAQHMRIYLSVLLLQIFISGNLFAQAYKCKTDSGKISYQAKPCDKAETESVIKIDKPDKPIEENQEGLLISKSDLLGTWTDLYPKSSFSSTWTFTSNELMYRRYSGKVVRASYTLEKDKIVVHHKKSALNKGPWDEVYELIQFEGDVLTVNSVTRLRLHKLK